MMPPLIATRALAPACNGIQGRERRLIAHNRPPREADSVISLVDGLEQVHQIARSIHRRLPQHVPLDDLVHEGVLGLIHASRHYDADKQVKFASYAAHRIRGAILDSLRGLDWLPRDLRRRAREVERARQKLSATLQRFPSQHELAVELSLSDSEIAVLLDRLNSGACLASADGEARQQAVNVPAAPADNPFDSCARAETARLVGAAVRTLPHKYREVIRLHYFEHRSMKEVGAALGLSESRISQIHSTAVVLLRGRLPLSLRATGHHSCAGAAS